MDLGLWGPCAYTSTTFLFSKYIVAILYLGFKKYTVISLICYQCNLIEQDIRVLKYKPSPP